MNQTTEVTLTSYIEIDDILRFPLPFQQGIRSLSAGYGGLRCKLEAYISL